MDNKDNKLSDYEVSDSIYAMTRAARAKNDKEHMKACKAELEKRKKDLQAAMKAMSMQKSQELKAQVAQRLAKASQEVAQEDLELVAVDVLSKAIELAKSQTLTEIAPGTQVIEDPSAVKKEPTFSGSLFKEYQLGSIIQNTKTGPVLTNNKPNAQDYVKTSNSMINNKVYSAEELAAEVAKKK
jgi:hypothetical protein